MIIQGDCLDKMREMADNSIDFVVTDPPYGLHFMGKNWDKFKKTKKTEFTKYKFVKDSHFPDGHWKKKIGRMNTEAGNYDDRRNDEFQEFIYNIGLEALRIVKPGGHFAMFGAPRRFHLQIAGLENAGWEIRDVMMWLFGQGFPKSHNFGKLNKNKAELGEEWKPYGTALKPAYEPIILAMKPLDGTFAENAQKWGVAGINIDAVRIETKEDLGIINNSTSTFNYKNTTPFVNNSEGKGRWPANIILDEEAAQALDEQTGILKSGELKFDNHVTTRNLDFSFKRGSSCNYEKDSGGASRFFYCAKASPRERGEGNLHPTVKPLSLMKYLLKLLAPPGDPVCLDPFAGSGTTLLAAKELGIRAIGIEREPEYCEIAKKRIQAA